MKKALQMGAAVLLAAGLVIGGALGTITVVAGAIVLVGTLGGWPG